jgi:hypothetical protein
MREGRLKTSAYDPPPVVVSDGILCLRQADGKLYLQAFEPSYLLAIPISSVYSPPSMSSRLSFTSFTLCYWRNPAASGVLACISENT